MRIDKKMTWDKVHSTDFFSYEIFLVMVKLPN